MFSWYKNISSLLPAGKYSFQTHVNVFLQLKVLLELKEKRDFCLVYSIPDKVEKHFYRIVCYLLVLISSAVVLGVTRNIVDSAHMYCSAIFPNVIYLSVFVLKSHYFSAVWPKLRSSCICQYRSSNNIKVRSLPCQSHSSLTFCWQEEQEIKLIHEK